MRIPERKSRVPAGRSGRHVLHSLLIGSVISSLGAYSCLADPVSTSSSNNTNILGFEAKLVVSESQQVILSVSGLRSDVDLSVYVGDEQIMTFPPEELEKVLATEPNQISFNLNMAGKKPGVYDLALKQGPHRHVREAGIFLTDKPKIQGQECGNRTEGLPVSSGELLAFEAVQQDGLKVMLKNRADGREHELTVSDSNLALPEVEEGDYELTVAAKVDDFDPRRICAMSLAIGPPSPKINWFSLKYDLNLQVIEMSAKGANLPDRLNAVQGGDSRPFELAAVAGNQQERSYRSQPMAQTRLQYSIIESDTSGDKLFKAKGRWIAGNANKWEWQWLKSPMEAEIMDLYEGESYGKVELELADESYEFARIPAGEYSIGLSAEKSDDPYLTSKLFTRSSSHRSGVVKVPLVRPFMIGVHEVTNQQYLSWIKTTNPPQEEIPEALRPFLGRKTISPKVAELPVTDVSYEDARGFARWLQSQLQEVVTKWQIRLPHELEWEMAARGMGDQDYVFTEENVESGLSSLSGEIRSVGTNDWDRGIAGVRDMAGNVREWTESVYNDTMLDILHLQMVGGVLPGWNPAKPEAIPSLFAPPPESSSEGTALMAVRGGANVETNPLHYLVGLRRKEEMASKKNDLGFRLVLVPVPADEG